MLLPDAFAPEAFRRLAHRVVDALGDHLEAAAQRRIPVLEPRDPLELMARWDRPVPERPAPPEAAEDELLALIQAVLHHSTHLHHPGYVGHQVATTLPASTVLEMTNALMNNGMAVYEMGQLQSVMERRVVEFLNRAVGFGEGAGGVLTHGGSLGNLTGLLAARQAMAGHDVWTEGQREPFTVLVSQEAHYCIARAVQVMGWGAKGAWSVPTDAEGRIDLEALERAHDEARSDGRRVVAVVGSACTTAAGRFDLLDRLAEFCQRHGLWFHVDGAHGASLVLSRRHRELLRGIERADSVVWDLHKMMGLPALNTAVLFREARRSHEAFAQEAGYLFEPASDPERCFDLGQRTLECTKRGMGVTAYCLLHTLGADWFGEQVDTLLARSSELADRLEEAEDFELWGRPEANILCFRHLGAPAGEALDRHQAQLRRRVLEGGDYYLVQTRLEGALWLRVTLMNPRTGPEDLVGLLAALRAATT